MTSVNVVTRGERETSLRFDVFPSKLTGRLEQKIRSLTEMLDERIEAATPKKTGLLSSEITPKIYTGDDGNRVAGYVSVFAAGRTQEYAKAATLEYGSSKTRKLAARLAAPGKRLEQRFSKRVHFEAFRYLRGPFEDMQPEIQAGLEETVEETIAEDEA